MSDAARRKAYAEITEIVKASFARYLEEFPERAGDARNVDSISWSLRGVHRVFRALDKFEITEKQPAKEPSPPKES